MLNEALPKPRIVHASKQVVQRKTDADFAAQTDAATQQGEFPLSGQQFGHYTLMRQLGQGGYARVYLAAHRYLNTSVALKLLNLVWASNEEVQRFLLEARILAHLRHRHIVRVLDFGEHQGTPFMVMEYASGGDLQQCFPQGRALPMRTILPVVMQIASALQYVHNHGLIHCDVKPENMLLGPQHEIRLSDFGIALTAKAARNQGLGAHELQGTAFYLAPEQLSSNPLPASDQYDLAVMAYQWLCGQYLFEGTGLQVCLMHLSTTPPHLRDLVPSIPPTVERVVLKALAKNPSQRFSHVHEFAYARYSMQFGSRRRRCTTRFLKHPASVWISHFVPWRVPAVASSMEAHLQQA